MSKGDVYLQSWSEFERWVSSLGTEDPNNPMQLKAGPEEPLFRGLGNSSWALLTTLERAFPSEASAQTLSLLSYYRKIDAAKPAIETLSGTTWVDVPNWFKFSQLLKQNNGDWLDRFFYDKSGIYRYLMYLRHHGFPSPFLDWTASPYIAAFFAFEGMDPNAQSVCVCSYFRDPVSAFSADQHFFVVGSYLQTHRRHFLQQSRYSLCVGVDGDDFTFVPHEPAIIKESGSFYRVIIPATERVRALKNLDSMNINPYSLFGSEDTLVKTIARRECLLKP